MQYQLRPVGPLQGVVTVPGDKSISHRAVMLGALAEGTTVIDGLLLGEDCRSTMNCFRQLGVSIDEEPGGRVIISGLGLRGLQEPDTHLDAGNSGTTMRLMLGVMAGQDLFAVLTGDASLRRRPMARVMGPLARMGASIFSRKGGLAPLAVRGSQLRGMELETTVASAQVKSALLLAGLQAQGTTSVTEPAASRDHTELMLAAFGVKVERQGLTVSVAGNQQLQGCHLVVPGDFSSAAFLLVAASIIPGSMVKITNVGINPTRTGLWEVLERMGARIVATNHRLVGNEPVADLDVTSAELTGVEIGGDLIPRLIDEIPALAVAAAVARGTTVIRDAAELRVKETDRVTAVATELERFGARITPLDDGMLIEGGATLTGARCDSYGDHRMAMALAIAGLAAWGTTVIADSQCIDVSFPGFRDVLAQLTSSAVQ